jgi:hypothetical protein
LFWQIRALIRPIEAIEGRKAILFSFLLPQAAAGRRSAPPLSIKADQGHK